MNKNTETDILILYRTKYGSTEQYAKWIAEEVRADILTIEDFDTTRLNRYSTIIFGSPTYMGKIQIKDFLEDNWSILKTKRIFLFITGLFPGESPESIKSYELIPTHIRDYIEYLKLPGRVEYKKLKFTEKMITKMVKTDSADKVSKDKIAPIIDWARKSAE